MPADNDTQNKAEKDIYSHIYNRGIENKIIFKDPDDYKVFLGYLKEYLSFPADPQNSKKTFIVNGRTFKGVPHQPKNFYKKVELVAYSLMPNHFSLLLKELSEKSLESFLRSLSTRYSMYFNKKYHRGGTLFQGPYKSIKVKEVSPLLLLSRYFHTSGDCSSYPEYSGARISSWVRPNTILSLFQKEGNIIYPGINNYIDFVKKYNLNENDKKILEGFIFESISKPKTEPLERRIPELARTETPKKVTISEPKKKSRTNYSHHAIPELFLTSFVFLILLTFGLRNINAHAETPKPSQTSTVSGVSNEVKEKVTEKTKRTVVIKTDDNSTINIRRAASVTSDKVGKTKDGESFEFVSKSGDWYEIRLPDATVGFVSKDFVEDKGEIIP